MNFIVLMSERSREAARAASVEILWVYQSIAEEEVSIIVKQENQTIRLKNKQQGKGRYLVHAIFLCVNPCDPLPQCGQSGDIWISEPNIYFKAAGQWIFAETEVAKAPQHPFLDRYLTMHPTHCSMQWIKKGSIRQHWSKDRWTLKGIESLKHEGIDQVAQRDDVKVIIGKPFPYLQAAQVSHYLSAVLPAFLDDPLSRSSVNAPQSASST